MDNIARRSSGAILIAATVMAGSGVARASGNELGGLFQVGALIIGAFPWVISCFLLLLKPSPVVWAFGTLMSGIALLMAASSELTPQVAFVGVAVLPGVGHLIRRVRAQQREHRDGGEIGGDGKIG
jgi:hypothetical protein